MMYRVSIFLVFVTLLAAFVVVTKETEQPINQAQSAGATPPTRFRELANLMGGVWRFEGKSTELSFTKMYYFTKMYEAPLEGTVVGRDADDAGNVVVFPMSVPGVPVEWALADIDEVSPTWGQHFCIFYAFEQVNPDYIQGRVFLRQNPECQGPLGREDGYPFSAYRMQ